MKNLNLVIKNGMLITPGGIFFADVGIVGERIAVIGEELGGAVELDATGCYVLPGGVDPHVHLQMPVGDYVSSDDFASGTRAAALGGTTTVLDFVEPEPGESLLEALEKRRAEADGRVAIDYGLHMTIPTWHAEHGGYGKPPSQHGGYGKPLSQHGGYGKPPSQHGGYGKPPSQHGGYGKPPSQHGGYGKPPYELQRVMEAGVTSFKLYTAYDGLRLDDVQLYRVLRAIADVDGLPLVHCENGPLCDELRAQAVAQGETSPICHALTRPPRQEAEAVSRVIDLAALAENWVYIVHVSCQESLARIRAARARGEEVYAETCPQYLLLDGLALSAPGGERLICSPALRTEEDNASLWEGLISGDLDVLATDHCPFTAAEKEEHADFTTIPGGLPSIEPRLSLAHHFGQQHWMTLARWVEVCSSNPARIFGLERKGQLAPGFDADLVIFDPERRVTLQAGKTLHERVDWSPYEGLRVRGWPRDVLSRGRVIVRQGEFIGEQGWGQFLHREWR